MRRPSRWGWALLGFTSTLLLAWGAATIWTVLQERSHELRITKIERVVLDPTVKSHRAPADVQRSPGGGDASQPATAGQKPVSGKPETPKPKPSRPKHEKPAGGDATQDTPPAAVPPEMPAAIDTPGKGKDPPADTPGAEAPGLVGPLTGTAGGLLEDIGKGADKALCPPAERLAGLCSD